MKTCNKCKIEKPLDQFFKDKANKTDGHYSICKECKTAGAMKWREANRDRYNAIAKIHNQKHYQRDRIRRYGLTVEQHQEMLNNQNNLCAICNSPPAEGKPLVVDHCHTSDQVRGLLCYKCNRDMAVIDNSAHLAKLIQYKNKRNIS